MIKGTVFHSFLRDLSASVPEAIMHRRQDQPSTRLEDPRKFAQELRAQIRSWQVRKNLAAQRDIEHAVSNWHAGNIALHQAQGGATRSLESDQRFPGKINRQDTFCIPDGTVE